MDRDWRDFKSIYGNIAGAREGFENACETLFRKIHVDKHVSQVSVKQGDGGIDIFIGELGMEPITVIQCKFFLESFDKSQQSQIRESFNTAFNSNTYELKEWILCIPRIIDINENSWWFKWKHKVLKENSKPPNFINLVNGNALIDLMKEHNIYNHVFKIHDSIKIDEIHKALIPKKLEAPNSIDPKTVLFNNYSKKNELYYLKRGQDVEFNQTIEVSNIWVFGRSGMGKTALINRNLQQKGIDYIFCDLSPITINSVDDVLNEIICLLEEKFEVERCKKETNLIKQITKLLENSKYKRIIIVIDELSIIDNELIKSLASSFINLVTHYSNSCLNEDLKFVVSTIADPELIIKNKSKASDYFQYICCDYWDTYIEELFDMLNTILSLEIDEENKLSIIRESRSSPRVLKNIFRKIVAFKEVSNDSIQKAIKLTIKESF